MDPTLQHVLVSVAAAGGAAWIVASALSTSLLARARAGGDASLVVTRAATVARAPGRIAQGASIAVAAAGAWYVIGNDLSIDPDWWIGTALAVWIVCFLGATAMRARHLRAAIRLSERDGADDEEVQWRIRRVDLLARGELLLLVVAAVVVVLRPVA